MLSIVVYFTLVYMHSNTNMLIRKAKDDEMHFANTSRQDKKQEQGDYLKKDSLKTTK